MVGLEAYSFYMCFLAVLAALSNIRVIRVVLKRPFSDSPGFDVIMLYQTAFALYQLFLWLLLCPRAVFVDGYFGVAFDGVAHFFGFPRVFYFAFLVFLSTNNVMTTAVSLYHRLLFIEGRKLPVKKVLMILAICSVPSLVVTVLLMLTGDWKDFTIQSKNDTLMGYELTTPRGQIVMGVTAAIPVAVFLFAMYVSWKANRLLSSQNRIAIKAMEKMRTTLWKAFIVQAAIPLIAGLAILSWYLEHMKFIRDSLLLEYLLFGVGPPLLHFQALITPRSIGRYRPVSIIAPFLFIFLLDCAFSITINGLYFTFLIGLLSLCFLERP